MVKKYKIGQLIIACVELYTQIDPQSNPLVVVSAIRTKYIYLDKEFIYFFLRSCEHLGQNHFPFGLVVKPTQAKWNHSIGHCYIEEKNANDCKMIRILSRNAVYLHQYCHIQSFRHMKPVGIHNTLVRSGQRAYPKRRLGVVLYVQ